MKIPCVAISRRLPPASHIPFITICRFLSFRPGFRRGQGIDRWREIAPQEIGMIRVAGETMILPLRLISVIAKELRKQALEEGGG